MFLNEGNFVNEKHPQMKILIKIISIAATYASLIENESLLNKKSTNYKETNNKTCIATYSLTSTMLFSLI